MNRLTVERRAMILTALAEGSSVNATARICECSKITVLRLLADAGTFCAQYHDLMVQNLTCRRVQMDEIWSFCGCKDKARDAGASGVGSVWTWVAMDADSKLCINWLVGFRDSGYATAFVEDTASRVDTRIQLTTDGHYPYLQAVEDAFGGEIDYAMLVKLYGEDREAEKRYSPAACIGCRVEPKVGAPDLMHISTSFVERQNLTMRMSMRRFTRLTNAFSKKIENHEHAIALHYFVYNWCRKHQTLKTTPAVASGLANRALSIRELVEMIEQEEERIGGRITDYLPSPKSKAQREPLPRSEVSSSACEMKVDCAEREEKRMIQSATGLLAFLMLVSAAAAQAPDTTFTYQGRLDLAGQPVTDTGDFQFTLWDAASGGNQIGQLVQVDGVDVAGGLFSVQLDFGAPAFGGERWLEVSVRTPAGSGAFSTLAPRQAVTASPYSIQTRGFFVDENENVGIGTTNPAGQLALGNYLGGTLGSAVAAYTKQLVLGGEYNAGPNVDDSVKLLISEYDNDPPSDIFPIYVEDENNGVDFYLRNSAGLRTAFFGGRVSAPQGFDGPLDASNLTGQIHESVLPQNAIDSSEIEDNSLTGDDMRGVTSSGAGSKPFHFQRYGPFGNGGTLNTGFPASSYIAVVVGFRTFDGDIEENGVGNPIFCYAFEQSGTWHVTFDLRSHNTHEGWEVWVMYVDRRMATITGF